MAWRGGRCRTSVRCEGFGHRMLPDGAGRSVLEWNTVDGWMESQDLRSESSSGMI